MTYPNELTNPAQANWPVRVNEAFKSLRGPALYARNDLTSTGLTLGYFGGELDASTTVADGTVSLTNTATNYVVAHRSTGAVSAATNTTNWDDTTTYGRVGIGVAAGGVVTSWKDARLWTGGIFRASGSAVDADDVTYTPTTLADWDGGTDPGDVEQALDQLAERVTDVEGAGGADASTTTYTPTTNADWDGSADPGNVDDALDQLAERVTDLEVGGAGDEHYEVDGTPASDDTWAGRAITGVNAGATIVQWEAVRMGSGGEWLLADATDDSTAPCHAIATAAGTDNNPLAVLTEGVIRNDAWNWTPGGLLYLSTTAGGLTQTAPSATGEIVQQVGFAISADVAYINVGAMTFIEVA